MPLSPESRRGSPWREDPRATDALEACIQHGYLPSAGSSSFAACFDPTSDAKGNFMSYRGETDEIGLNLDVYGEGDEATLRRDSGHEPDLEYYDEEDIATVPWIRRVN
jgi:hypothetical protein